MNSEKVVEIAESFGGTITKNGPGSAGSWQVIVKFPNTFSASVIIGGQYAYGGLELGVLDSDGALTYDTSITDDVLGYLDEESLTEALKDISEL